ncbi:MAG: hypothetical protein KDA24_07530 [Deltaproteobacteria bacterium]|nr:hypothetical protein [Deltaproteobacteria bacterium]
MALLACAWVPGAAAAQDDLPAITQMTPEQAEEVAIADRERLAREQLQQAKLRFERGEFQSAVQLFEGILSPVRLRTADDLHDGFLHWAFTLILMGDKVTALERLDIALQLKPAYAPSPVTTRPDLLTFYEEKQSLFLAAGGVQRLPTELFPELAGSGVVRTRREPPIPLFGIRLRQLGQPSVGNALMGVEVGSAILNGAGWILWASVFQNLGPSGDTWRQVFFVSNPITVGVFWTAITVELIVTAVMNRRASLRVGELRPFEGHPGGERLRRQARDRHARRRSSLSVGVGPGGFVLRGW